MPWASRFERLSAKESDERPGERSFEKK